MKYDYSNPSVRSIIYGSLANLDTCLVGDQKKVKYKNKILVYQQTRKWELLRGWLGTALFITFRAYSLCIDSFIIAFP